MNRRSIYKLVLFSSVLLCIVFLSAITSILLYLNSSEDYIIISEIIGSPKVMITDIDGELTSTIFSAPYSQRGLQRNVSTSADSIKKLIEYFSQDGSIKAFVFRINSTGSSSSAGEEMARSINRLNVTTVALINGAAYNSAYLVASSADLVFISLNSIIEQLAETNVTINRMEGARESICDLSSTKLADLNTGDCNLMLDQEQRKKVKDYIEERTDISLDIIAQNRKMGVAQARTFTNNTLSATDALEYGLADKIGGMDDVLKELRLRIGGFDVINIKDLMK